MPQPSKQRFPFQLPFQFSCQLSETQWLIGLGIASLCLYLINLGSLALRDWDEATYAMAARGMIQTGDWLHPTLLGQPFLDKTPLGFWLMATSYSLFGVSEWSTRFPLALLSALGVPLFYLVAQKLFNAHLPARISSLVYLTLLPVVRHNRLAMLDGGMISLFLLLLLCYLKAKQNRRWLWGIGFCFGAMALLKSVLAVLLTGLVLGLLCLERQFKLLRSPGLWLSMLLGLVPLAAWYLAQGSHYGANFWEVHFLNQTFNRTWDAVNHNTGPIWFYAVEILKYSWPWLVFLPAGLWLGWQQRQTGWGKLALWGSLGFLVIISAMRTKLPWYVVPIYPLLSLSIGAELSHIWEDLTRQDLSHLFGTSKPINFKAYKYYLAFLVFLTLLGLAVSIIYGLNRDVWVCAIGLLIGLTGGGAAYLLWQKQRNFISWLFAGMYLGLLVFCCSPVWIWELNEAFPVKPVAQLVQSQVPKGKVVYTSFDYGRPSLNFYSEHPVIAADAPEILRRFRQKDYLLLDAKTFSRLDPNTYQNLGTAEGLTLVRAKSVTNSSISGTPIS